MVYGMGWDGMGWVIDVQKPLGLFLLYEDVSQERITLLGIVRSIYCPSRSASVAVLAVIGMGWGCCAKVSGQCYCSRMSIGSAVRIPFVDPLHNSYCLPEAPPSQYRQ